jgi:hypothetical protein
MSRVASKVTFFDATTPTRVISANTITVNAVVVGNSSGSTADIRFVDNLTDLNDYFVLSIANNSSVIMDITFLADSGFAWSSNVTDTDLNVGVFHGQDGA